MSWSPLSGRQGDEMVSEPQALACAESRLENKRPLDSGVRAGFSPRLVEEVRAG